MGEYGQFHDPTVLGEGMGSEYLFVIYDKKHSFHTVLHFLFAHVSDNTPQTQISQKRLSHEHHSTNEEQTTKLGKLFMYILNKICSIPVM